MSRPRLARRAGAVLAGLVTIFALSLGTDVMLHATGVFPGWGRPMSDALFGVATAYRTIYAVLGCWLTARLAPDRPLAHALALGALGVVLSSAGAAATWSKGPEFGPHWYTLALIASALPCAWAGGWLVARTRPPAAAEAGAWPERA